MNAILFGTTSAVALAALASAAVDLTPAASAWAQRIGIGRFPDEAAWRDAAAERAMKWLIRTPTVRLTDQTRLLWLDMLRGEYKRAAIQHWQEAALVLGLTELAGAEIGGAAGLTSREASRQDAASARDVADARFRSRLRAVLGRFLDRKFGPDGAWREKPEQVDAAMLAWAVMRSGMEPDRYRRAYDETAALVLRHVGDDGLIRYRQGAVGGYRYVDTIGLVCPFLAAYGLACGRDDCVDLAVRQIEAYDRHGLHPGLDLPYHAYAARDGRPLGLCGWGRGVAWYAIGLAEVWRLLPASDRRKAELEARVARLARAAARFQQPDGSWRWTVTRPETRADSSATAALAWFLAVSAAASGAPEDARERARRALAFLRGVTRRGGAVDFAQGDTRDIGVYAQRFDVLPFAQGFALRASAAASAAEPAESAERAAPTTPAAPAQTMVPPEPAAATAPAEPAAPAKPADAPADPMPAQPAGRRG
jgi:unsaturated rhamnogalacturonyl hydrolase